jgi:hypothetical protein
LGLSVQRGGQITDYNGNVESTELLLTHRSGRAGIVKDQREEDTFNLVADYWRNPIAEVVGRSGDKFMQAYAEETVNEFAVSSGYVVSSRSVKADGTIQLRVSM